MKRDAIKSCFNTLTDHLNIFLDTYPSANYEEWIQELHPENVLKKKNKENKVIVIDHRFYVEDSDHRQLWNAACVMQEDGNMFTREPVPAKKYVLTDSSSKITECVEPKNVLDW